MKLFIGIILIGAIALFGISTFYPLISDKAPPSHDITQPNSTSTAQKPEENKNSIKNTFDTLLSGATQDKDEIRLKGEDKDQISFLFLGIGGEEHISGKYLSDTNILIILMPSTKKAAIISIPRDLLVKSPTGSLVRINALYSMGPEDKEEYPGQRGVEHTKNAIKDITGVEVDYYMVLDLEGVKEVVDTLGGINVRRSDDLTDTWFPDESAGYETYEINEGWRYLDGEQAVKFIRTRHTSGGDFDRMQRQQEVALAIKRKLEGLKSISGIPKLFSVYESLQDRLTTDLKFNEIMRLADLTDGLENESIVFDRLTAQDGGLLKYDSIIWNNQRASVLSPKAGRENYEEIRKKINGIISDLKK